MLRIPQRKPYGTMEGNVKKALKVMLDFSLYNSIYINMQEFSASRIWPMFMIDWNIRRKHV